jgi:hypothetical protein
MRRVTTPIPRPSAPRERPSVPIANLPSSIFRPRGALAVGILVIPALIFLALIVGVLVARLAGQTGQMATVMLGIGIGMALGWIACVLLFARMLLVTIAVAGDSLIASFPWGGKREIRWILIDRADRQLGVLRLRSSDGIGLLILPTGLTDGEQLLRQIILRVSPSVLSAPLQRELAILGGNRFVPAPHTPYPQLGIAPLWFVLAGGIAVGGAALTALGSFRNVPLVLAIGAVVGLVGVVLLLVLRQTIILTDTGLTITRTLRGPRSVAWTEIKLIEQLPLEIMLALRSEQRIVFLGPFFMTAMRRGLLRNALHTYLIDRGVPVYQRWRL